MLIRLDIAELFSLVLDEGRAREQDLGVDLVVLDLHLADVLQVDLQLPCDLVDVDRVENGHLLLGGFSCLPLLLLGHFLLLVDLDLLLLRLRLVGQSGSLGGVDLVQLLLHLLEDALEVQDGEVLVLGHNLPDLLESLAFEGRATVLLDEELKVGCHVVVDDLACTVVFSCFVELL